jgi:electron transfer flavoprotein alpha subunit
VEAGRETVLVLAEGGRPAQVLLTLARRLGTPVAVTAGEADLEMLARFGSRAVWTVAAGEVDTCPATVRVEALSWLAAATKPVCVLVAEDGGGREIAGRLAVRLDSGVLTGAVDVWMGPHGPVVTQRVLDGAYLAESEVVRGVTICAVRTCEVEPVAAPARPAVHSLKLALPHGLRAAHLVPGQREPEDLKTAAVVVAGGHGLGSRHGFAVAGRLARALGGAVCGSFTATELGWCPPGQRVDQVGTTVHPLLYLALGVSGSIRHRAGMQTAQTIVAVNRDPQAPIFGVADLGIIGDARDVARELLKEIERRNS